jgi:hypothetical protein
MLEPKPIAKSGQAGTPQRDVLYGRPEHRSAPLHVGRKWDRDLGTTRDADGGESKLSLLFPRRLAEVGEALGVGRPHGAAEDILAREFPKPLGLDEHALAAARTDNAEHVVTVAVMQDLDEPPAVRRPRLDPLGRLIRRPLRARYSVPRLVQQDLIPPRAAASPAERLSGWRHA